MPVLSQKLYARCRSTLLKCNEFNSDASVRAIFITKDLYPFRTGLPGASNKSARVTGILEYLLDQESDANLPVLVTFLYALSGHYTPGNALRSKLQSRAHEVEAEIGEIGGDGEEEKQSDSLPNPLDVALPGINVSLLTDKVPTAYCYQLTSKKFPFVEVKIDNTGRGNVNAAFRIEADLEDFSDSAVVTPQVMKGKQTKVTLLPSLRKEAVTKLSEMCPTTLRVTVHQTAPTEQLLHEQTYPIRLHARNTALLAVRGLDGGILDLSDYLAAWVTPRSSVTEQWLRRAANHHPKNSLVGYQGASDLLDGAKIVRAQAQAIFAMLKQDANITYVNSTLNMEGEGGQITQRVRLPSESLAAGGSANCIDGSVLFASFLELASLDPMLVLVPGHAFVGWRIWRGVDQYEFLETTMIGSSDFSSAQDRGRQQYENALLKGYFSRGLFDPGGFARLIDIAACRDRDILPLE